MTAAIIALALLALSLGIALVFAVRWGISAKDEANTAGDMLRGTKELVTNQEIQIKTLKQENATLAVRAKLAEQQRNEAKDKARKETVDKIRNAKPEDAAKIVNETLGAPASVVDIRTGGPIGELK